MIADSKVINYIVVIVSEFATSVNMNLKDAFNYLKKYKGLEHLVECYEIEHTLSIDDTLDCIKEICERNGGILAWPYIMVQIYT